MRGRKPKLDHFIIKPDGPRPRVVAPRHLGKRAREIYRDLVHMLMDLSLWHPGFGYTISVLAEAIATHEEATAAIAATGRMLQNAKGDLVVNPWLRVARDAGETVRRISQEYGWTPVALSRVYRSGKNPGKQKTEVSEEAATNDDDLYPYE